MVSSCIHCNQTLILRQTFSDFDRAELSDSEPIIYVNKECFVFCALKMFFLLKSKSRIIRVCHVAGDILTVVLNRI